MSLGPLALEVDGLETGYDGVTVLRSLSITVPAGEAVAVLGPNGAGKTTMLRAISGFLPARRGRVVLGGTDVTRWRPDARAVAGLCHIPQGRGIYASLTVRENLLMQSGGAPASEAIDKAVTAFPRLGDRLGQRAGTLSGGQQQMLSLAAAHVRDPTIILVDEASLGLAPRVVDEIFDFLHRQAAAGTAIVVVDQFARRALGLASTAYVLRKGAVAYCGPADDLLDHRLFDRYLGIDQS